MKLILIGMLIISAFTFRITLPSTLSLNDINNQIQITSQGGVGPIKYQLEGLPQGFIVLNNRIAYTGTRNIQGQLLATIKGTDQDGKLDREVVVINTNLNSGIGLNRLIDQATNQLVRLRLNQNLEGSGLRLPSTSQQSSASSSSSTVSTSSSSSSSSTGGFLNQNVINSEAANLQLISGLNNLANLGGSSSSGANTNIEVISSLNQGSPTTAVGGQTIITAGNTERLITQYNPDLLNNILQSKTITNYPVPTVIVAGNLPNQVPNTQVITVTSSQADRGNSGVKPLTQYDQNITALFNQQTQLGHTVANLLQIVRQGAANRQKLQIDIDGLTKKLNSQVLIQQQFALAISTQQNKIKNIQTAIVNANNTLNGLNGNLNGVNDQIDKARRNGLQLTQRLNIAINNQDGFKGQIVTAKQNVARLTTSIRSSKQVCDQADGQVIRLTGNISSLRTSIAGIDQRVAGIDRQIGDHQKQIAALQAQINALNGRITQARADRQVLVSLNYTVPQQIANLNAQIIFQQQRCNNAGGNQADLKAAIDLLADLQKRDLGNNNDIVVIRADINLLKSNLDDLLAKNNTLVGQIRVVQNNINSLRLQLPDLQNRLNKLYLQANRGLQIVKTTNETLGAAAIRFKRESDALAIANLNLQQARAQQQKIRQSINLIVQQNTAGLPFPSAPLTTGINGTISQINTIDSINLFLLNAYGSTFQFQNYYRQFLGVSRLYRFGAANSLLSNCAISKQKGGNKLLSSQGKITEIGDDFIRVQNAQGLQTLNLDGCSLTLANVNNYNYNIGDVIYWKGYYDLAMRSWDVAQCTCFH